MSDSQSLHRRIIIGVGGTLLWFILVNVVGDSYQEQLLQAPALVKHVLSWSVILPLLYAVAVAYEAWIEKQENLRKSKILAKLHISKNARKRKNA